MKKSLSAILALVTAVTSMSFMSSCGKKEPVEADVSSLTYWVPIQGTLASHVQSQGEVEMYKKREEDTGIHIDFIHPAVGQENEQFTLLLASGELPDIIEYNWSVYPGGMQKAIDDGLIIAIDDYLEYAPNFKKRLEKGELAEVYRKNSVTDNGEHFGFTTLNTGDYRIFGGIGIRRDMLKKFGLEMPETIDDWTNVLRTFKKNGVKTPLTGNNLKNFVGAFGIGDNYYVDNGKVKYGCAEPAYKDYLETVSMWYKEGLLDNELYSNTSTLIDAKITDGSAGAVTSMFIGGQLGRYMVQKSKEDPSYDLVGAPYPVLKKGDINRFPDGEGDVSMFTAAISTSCKNPIAAVKWLDYWYSDEGYNLMNFGVEGVSYDMVDGKPVYKDIITNNPDGLSINEALQLYCKATTPTPGLKQAPEYLDQYYPYEQQKETLKLWTANTDAYRSTALPTLCSSEDEADRLNSLRTELSTYVSEMGAAFITGKEPLSNFDDYVAKMNDKFNLGEILDIMQTQLERYNAR